MTRSIPFHKQTDMTKQAGQQSFDRMPFLKHSTAEPGLALDSGEFIPAKELTLNDYIARKQEEPKRITFDEYMIKRFPQGWENFDGNLSANDLEHVWNAALKQGKL